MTGHIDHHPGYMRGGDVLVMGLLFFLRKELHGVFAIALTELQDLDRFRGFGGEDVRM